MNLTHREKMKLMKVNTTMDVLHSLNNDIYECWMDDDYKNMRVVIKKQMIELKNLLNGIQEET